MRSLAGATIPAAFDTLFNFSGPGALNALTQIAGEVATGMQQAGFRAMDLFLGVMLNPFLHGRGETGAAARRWRSRRSVSRCRRRGGGLCRRAQGAGGGQQASSGAGACGARPIGGTSNSDGDVTVGSQDTRTNAYGFAAGVDHRLTPNTLVGFALAGGGTNWSLANGLGTGRSDMFQAGVYGSHRFAGSAYVSAALAYTWHDASTRALSRFPPRAAQCRLPCPELRRPRRGRLPRRHPVRWRDALWRAAGAERPHAGLCRDRQRRRRPVRTELCVQDHHGNAKRDRLVVRPTSLVGPDAALTLRGRVAWAHDFNTDRNIAATFQTLPLASFTVNGASPAQDFALISAAAEMQAAQWLVVRCQGRCRGGRPHPDLLRHWRAALRVVGAAR